MIFKFSETTPAGWEGFLKEFEAAPVEAQREIMLPALRDAANKHKPYAQAAAPVGHHGPIRVRKKLKTGADAEYRTGGNLARSVGVSAIDMVGKVSAWVFVKAFYGRFLEYGTKKMSGRKWLSQTDAAVDEGKIIDGMLRKMERKFKRGATE